MLANQVETVMALKTGELSGQVAWVSGAGTGNGEAIAERLLSGGARVALVGRRLEPLPPLSTLRKGVLTSCRSMPPP